MSNDTSSQHKTDGYETGRLSYMNGKYFTMQQAERTRPTDQNLAAEWQEAYERGRRDAINRTRHILEST